MLRKLRGGLGLAVFATGFACIVGGLQAADPSLSPEWPVSISIPGWTTYSKDQIVACKGPGE